jgi:anti-sigma B factor antagonist
MQSGPTLEIVVERSGNSAVLTPKGDVDMARSPVLRKAIGDAMKSSPDRLVLDLSAVSYMDSSGLATLVEALQNSRKGAVPLSLCALTPRVRSILEIARLNTVFSLFDSREQALAS